MKQLCTIQLDIGCLFENKQNQWSVKSRDENDLLAYHAIKIKSKADQFMKESENLSSLTLVFWFHMKAWFIKNIQPRGCVFI